MLVPGRQAYRRVLALTIARGGLAPTVDQELLIDLLLGSIWLRLLITRDPITREYVDAVIQAVLTAVAVEQMPGCPQGSCKVVKQTADLALRCHVEAAVRYGVRALPLTDRLSGRADLRRGRVVAMQVRGVAVAQAA